MDLPIQRFVYTPDEIDAATAQSEEKVYFVLFKAIDKLQRYAEFKYLSALNQLAQTEKEKEPVQLDKAVGIHHLFKDNTIFSEILPGWKTERVFNINEPRFRGGPSLRTPFAVMASKGSDLLIVFRRPLTTYDARLALYNQQSFKYLYNFTGEVHDGSSTIYQTLSGVLEFAIKGFYESQGDAIKTPFKVL